MANNINIAELARHCQVSQATVSRVFSGATAVRPETRERILSAARALNYAPQQTARKDYIAVIVPSRQMIEPPSWFAGMLAMVLMREIHRAGYIAQFYDAGDMQLIHPNFTVAAIALNWQPDDSAYEQLIALQRPVIAINNENIVGAHSVCTHHARGVEMAINHLADHGHRAIGMLDYHSGCWGDMERMRGYRDAMEAAGLGFDPALVGGGNREDGRLGLDTIRALLDHGATALICPHEDWTMELQHYLGVLGVRVPEDVSVIAGEIPGLTQWLNPPYTTIGQDPVELADAAIEVIGALPRRARFDMAPQRRRLLYHFYERDSVGPPPAGR